MLTTSSRETSIIVFIFLLLGSLNNTTKNKTKLHLNINAVVDCPVSNWPRGTALRRHQPGGNQYEAGRDFWPEQGGKPGNNQQNIIRQHQQDTCWMCSPSICNCAAWKAGCTVLPSSSYSSWWWLPWVPTPANGPILLPHRLPNGNQESPSYSFMQIGAVFAINCGQCSIISISNVDKINTRRAKEFCSYVLVFFLNF